MADVFANLEQWAHSLPRWPEQYVRDRPDVQAFGESYHDAVVLIAELIVAGARKARKFGVASRSMLTQATELACVLTEANDEIDELIEAGRPLAEIARVWRARKAELQRLALDIVRGL